jgi:hypothetical protein
MPDWAVHPSDRWTMNSNRFRIAMLARSPSC